MSGAMILAFGSAYRNIQSLCDHLVRMILEHIQVENFAAAIGQIFDLFMYLFKTDLLQPVCIIHIGNIGDLVFEMFLRQNLPGKLYTLIYYYPAQPGFE